MPESLLDFGGPARLAIGLGQLEQSTRHNDILQQGADTRASDLQLEREKLVVEKAKIHQGTMFRAFDEIEKLAKTPQYQTNPLAQIDLRYTQANLLRHGLGIDVPVPSREELVGAHEEFAGMLKAMRGDDPEAFKTATERVMLAAPDYADNIFKNMKAANDLGVQGEQLQAKIELNKAFLTKLNIQTGRYTLQQSVYGENLGALGQTVQLPNDPRFKEHFRKMQGFTKPEAKSAYLKLNPVFKQQWDQMIDSAKGPVSATIMALDEQLLARENVLRDQQSKSPDGVAPVELAEEVSGYQQVLRARKVQRAWLEDPFNPVTWKGLRKAEQDVRVLHLSAGQRLQTIQNDRLAFQQKKMDVVQAEKSADSYGQERFLTHVTAGFDDNQAAKKAMEDTHAKFPGVAVDAGKFKNMSRVGKQEVHIKMGQEDVSRNLKMIDASQGVIDFAHDLTDRITANPMIVGKGAKLSTAFAGSAQQLRALVQLDPVGAKFLNTQTRDEAEALHEILVYLQAKSMDPTGALDLKVVENARNVVGDLSSFTTGPQQSLNKLKTVTMNAERNIRRARRNLKGGIQAALEDPPSHKPITDQTEKELMETILQGLK